MGDINNNDRLLGMDEAADFLEISKNTLYDFTHKKAIPFCRYGRFVKFKLEDLRAWKAARLVEIPTGTQMQAKAAIYCARKRR